MTASSKMMEQNNIAVTSRANWVLQGRLIQGAHPSSLDDDVHIELLDTILKTRVNTFVSLLEEDEQSMFRPYEEYVKMLAFKRIKFIKLPIPDMGITEDRRIWKLAKHIVRRLQTSNDVFYVHCWGGHGRSGTLVSLVLVLLGMSAEKAIRYVNRCHKSRSYNGDVPSPQTLEQIDQVCRLCRSHRLHRSHRSSRSHRSRYIDHG